MSKDALSKDTVASADSAGHGVPELDEDHSRLYATYHTIRASLEDERGAVDLKGLAEELLTFARDHFTREEELMAAHAYPDLEAHRKLHDTFLRQIGDIRDFVRAGGEPDDFLARFLVQGFVGKWLKMHTLVADRAFSDWLALHVRGEPPKDA